MFSRFIELTDSCWLWRATGGHLGQAVFGYANENEPDASVGKGNVIMHSCDNPMCVNPDHLSIGTHRNMQSLIARDIWKRPRWKDVYSRTKHLF